MGSHFTHQCASIALTFHQHELSLHTASIGGAGGWLRVLTETLFLNKQNLDILKTSPRREISLAQETTDFTGVYWAYILVTQNTCSHYSTDTPAPLDRSYDWISGQSSLLCDTFNLVTTAAGISRDGLQRVRGSSRGLRNNTKKAVTVTFELGVMGLRQRVWESEDRWDTTEVVSRSQGADGI